jgi:hypothetical protein
LDRIVAEVVAAVDPARAKVLDLVFVLDDLESANRDQPGVVVDSVRAAFLSHVDGYRSDESRYHALRRAVREKVSFHLAVPMIEAWFFGAPQALTQLGVFGDTPYHIRSGDPEDFESTDRAYIAAADTVCSEWCRRRRPRADRPKWVGAGQARVFHPKGYLQWLLLEPAEKNCTRYREGVAGTDALAPIAWQRLLGSPSAFLFLRAMVQDLSLGLGQEPSVESWAGQVSHLTAVGATRTDPVLRNL